MPETAPSISPVDSAPSVQRGLRWPPSAARIHDVQLGGSLNFAADRALAGELDAAAPGLGSGAQAGRHFVVMAVRRAARAGIDQFLDLGCGVSAADGVHPAARIIDPRCRVVHVDVDPVALAHARTVAASAPGLSVVEGDVRDVEDILGQIRARRHLDLDRPVAVVAAAMLHFVPGNLTPPLTALCAGTAPGSVLVLSHLAATRRTGGPSPWPARAATTGREWADTGPDGRDPYGHGLHGCGPYRDDPYCEEHEHDVVRGLYARTATPVTVRSPGLLASRLTRSGWRLLPPGIGTAGPRTPGGLGLVTAIARH